MLSVIVIEPPDPVVLPGGTTVVDRLVAQIERLADDGHAALTGGAERIASGDLRRLRALLAAGDDVAVIDGGAVIQAPALRAVLGDDRLASGLLVARERDREANGPLTLDRDGSVVVTAGSPFHGPVSANAVSKGVLRLDAASASRVGDVLPATLPTASDHPDEDPAGAIVDVLAAAAVEAGVRLRPVDLRRMRAFRPATPSDALHALRSCEDHDEDRAWLDAAVKAKDGWFTTFFVSPYSRFVARWSARVGLSPNQVTAASALVGVIAAAAFAVGTLSMTIVGAVALQLAFMLDCVDGQLSRYTQRFSTFGAWLDSMLDRGKELLVYLGLAIGGLRADEADIWLLAIASAALLVLRHSVDIAFEAARPTPALEPAPRRQPARDATDACAESASAEPATVSPDPPANPSPTTPRARPDPRSIARSRPIMWLLRFLAFPIGERFAALSLLAIFATRRTTFLVLLVWGVIAWAASITLKLARSRQWSSGRLDWLVAAAPRLLEYGTVVGVAVAVADVRPAAYGLIFALGLRHYDEGYRARTLGEGRTGAVTRTVLGAWYLRIVVLVAGAVLGVAVPVTWGLTGIVAVLAAVDLVRAWLPSSSPKGASL